MRWNGLACVALAWAALGCSDSATERAEARAWKDREVGLAQAGGVSFAVEEGLASVRRAAPGALELWGGAPAFHVQAEAEAGAEEWWTVVVRNALVDARLGAVVEGTGEALEVEALTGRLPTEKVWRVRLRAGARARLTVAPPEWDRPRPFRFAALADVQEALPRVGEVYARVAEDPSLRFIFFSGDLTRFGSPEELEDFQSRLESSPIPLYAAPGNHEYITADERWHEYFGRTSLHFTLHGVHFTLLDSGEATLAPLAYQQLEGWVAQAREAVHILGTHIPLVDPVGVRNGGFSSRPEASAILALLARGRVDLTLYGHVHSYYAFENAGVPAFISGGGGALPERFDGVGRHFLAVEVDPGQDVRSVELVRVDATD